MSFYKTVIVTKPSTLSEMYIENEKNGITIEKNIKEFSQKVKELLENENKLKEIGILARKSYEENYSRYKMGLKIGRFLEREKHEK